MSRRPPRRSQAGMSLFPFLAVLVCTMGAIISLLMMMLASAGVHAATAREEFEAELAGEPEFPVVEAAPESPTAPPFSEAIDEEKAHEAKLALEDAEWRKEILLQQREELKKKLSDRRTEVGYLEQSLRTLQDQADGLFAQAKALEENGGDAQALAAELAELERRIAEETAKLEQAKAAKDAEPTSYAIMPYDGPNGTRRRPLFIECTGQAVILQPEGIVLNEQDFAGPLLPGNPLDAALRAAQEYLNSHGGEGVHGSAYPLFVVREKGAMAYSVARGSIKSWENEFGYELIPDDMKLAYAPVDPGLKQAMQTAIEEARQRQAALIAAQPARFAGTGGGGGRVLRALPSGGFAAVGGGRPAGSGSGNLFGAGNPDKPIEGSSGTGSEPSAQMNAKNVSETKSKSPDAPPGSIGSGGAAPKSAQEEEPIAKNRGAGWAVEGAGGITTPLDRPVRVQIFEDRLLIVPEKLTGKEPTQIALTERTSASIDSLVTGVQERIRSWGHAGRGFYWQPRLIIEVRPGGERRYADLSRLLENSGIVVEAAQP